MGFEIEDAGKFDDIGVQLNGEWFLIQTKHSQSSNKLITKEMLFDAGAKAKDESFQLLKYLKDYTKMNWKHENIKHLIIFTNRNIEEGEFYSKVGLDDMFEFSTGTHIKLRSDDMINALRDEAFKNDFNNIRKAIINLFANGLKDAILDTYQVYLNKIIKFENKSIQLSRQIKSENSYIIRLHEELKKPLTGKSVSISDEPDFWSNNPNPIKTDIEEKIVKEFFSKLVLSVAQPSVKQLKHEMINESRLWMRTWIRPDDFGRLEEVIFERPLNAIKKEFDEYEKLLPERTFLQGAYGNKILEKVKAELGNEIQSNSKHSCTSLAAISYYYINRLIRSKQCEMIGDTEFVEQLYCKFKNQTCFVLTAQPGMGKSTLWQYLAFEAQKTHSKNTVFLIYLNNLPSNIPSIEQLDDILTMNIFNSDLSRSNVEMIVNENKIEIVLFLDAFDELRASESCVLKLITVLLQKPNVKIIISGRKHVKETLEKHLNVVSLELQEFNRDEQTNFLQRFWKHNVLSDKFSKFSKMLLDKFHRDIARKDYDFTGIPLMIRMVAEIFAGPFEEYLNSSWDDLEPIIPEGKFSVISLYEQFAKKCIQITMNKKNNVDNNKELDAFFNRLVKDVDYDYQVFGMQKFYYTTNFITDKKYYETLQSFVQNIKNQQSLIVELVHDRPSFTHLSFEEYFAAKYLFNLVRHKQSRFSNETILVNLNRSENTRNFFLAMVDAQILDSKQEKINFEWFNIDKIIIWSCRRDYVEIVKHFYDYNHYKAIRDKDQKSLLQIAIKKFAIKTQQFFLEKGAYPVHIAVECNRLDFIEKHISDVNSLDDDGSTPIFRAKFTEIFKDLIRYGAKLEMKNKNGDTVLHAAIESGDLKFIEGIFNLKDLYENHISEYILCKNNHGETPLRVAAKKGRIDILIFLLENYPSNYEKCLNETVCLMNIAIEEYFKNDEIDQEIIIRACELIGIDVNSANSIGNTVLHLAAEKNCKELTKMFFKNGANLCIKNKNGETPLHLAVRNNSFKVVEFLVPLMSDISKLTDEDGNTALHLAAKLTDFKCLNLLIKTMKKSLDTKNKAGMSALNCAIERREKENVQLLLHAGAQAFVYFDIKPSMKMYKFFQINLDAPGCLLDYLQSAFSLTQTTFNSECEKTKQLLEKIGFNKPLEGIEHLLYDAAELGWVELVKFLIANKTDVNCRIRNGRTPLMYAGTKEIYNLLTSAGATEGLIDNCGNTGLHIATEKNSIEMVEYYLDKNSSLANCKNDDEETPLHQAAFLGNDKIVTLLITNNADIDVKDGRGETPATYALIIGRANVVRSLLKHSAEAVWQGLAQIINHNTEMYHLEQAIVEDLIEAGLDVNKVYNKGLTLLHYAAQISELGTLKLLVKAGVDVNALDNSGNSSLHHIKHNYNEDAGNYLIANSFDINCKNDKGKTPLHVNIEGTFGTDNAKVLLTKNACIHLKDNLSNTALHLAILNDKEEIALHLIDLRAHLNEQNNDGSTAMHLAVLKNSLKIVQKLLIHGADLSLKNRDNKTAIDLAAANYDCREIFKYLTTQARTNNSNPETTKSRKRKLSK